MAGDALENAFHERMLAVYQQVGRSTKYWPHYFRRKVVNKGGLEAAKSWRGDTTDVLKGFCQLAKIARLEFETEALVMRKRWSQLFTQAERGTALPRLEGTRIRCAPQGGGKNESV